MSFLRILLSFPLALAACGGAPPPPPPGPGATTLPGAQASAASPPPAPPPAPAACSSMDTPLRLEPPALQATSSEISRENLRAWVELLADPKLAGRESGSPQESAVARLLASQLARFGWSGALSDNSYCQTFGSLRRDQNVAARFPGGASGGAPRKVLIVGAHYDGQGHCGAGGEACPSADDNASGVAALLEVARVLGQRGAARPPVDVLLIFFGAEERGALGSKYFVAHPLVPMDRVVRMINLDMVGRPFLDGNPLRYLLGASKQTMGYVVGERDRQATQDALEAAKKAVGAHLLGIPESVLTGAGFLSDSVPFGAQVPTLFLSTSIHDDYHQPGDTADKVDVGQIERAARLVLALVDGA